MGTMIVRGGVNRQKIVTITVYCAVEGLEHELRGDNISVRCNDPLVFLSL